MFNSERKVKQDIEGVFKAYYAQLCHFAFQLIADKDKAEDLSQEAFIVYWNNKEDVASDAPAIKKFLFATVKNACLNKLRREKIEQRYLNGREADPIEDPVALNAMIRSEVMNELYKAISELPQGCQLICRMGYLEGLKNPRIAEILGVSVNTVKTQKKRGLQLLRLRLHPEIFSAFLLLVLRG